MFSSKSNSLKNFNPLPLCRGRPRLFFHAVKRTVTFQSSPSMQRETMTATHFHFMLMISILSLYAEGDVWLSAPLASLLLFQSSPSMQRETNQPKPSNKYAQHFNPLPLCRGRLGKIPEQKLNRIISILSLYAEGDANKPL